MRQPSPIPKTPPTPCFRCPPSRHCHRKLHARRRPRHRQPPHYPLPAHPWPRRGPDAATRNPLEWPSSGRLYGELCADIQLKGSALALAAHLEELCAMAGLPRRLADCQVAASDLPVMAQEAAGQWTGTFNPLPLQAADFWSFTRWRFDGEGRIISIPHPTSAHCPDSKPAGRVSVV